MLTALIAASSPVLSSPFPNTVRIESVLAGFVILLGLSILKHRVRAKVPVRVVKQPRRQTFDKTGR